MLKRLRKDGWYIARFDGTSHRHLKHPTKPGTVTVAGPEHKEIPIGTEKAILRDAGLQ